MMPRKSSIGFLGIVFFSLETKYSSPGFIYCPNLRHGLLVSFYLKLD